MKQSLVLHNHLEYLVKKMNTHFKQAESYKELGNDNTAYTEAIKHSLLGATYKDCFEKLCDIFGIKRQQYLK